jgi:hypothetical protein
VLHFLIESILDGKVDSISYAPWFSWDFRDSRRPQHLVSKVKDMIQIRLAAKICTCFLYFKASDSWNPKRSLQRQSHKQHVFAVTKYIIVSAKLQCHTVSPTYLSIQNLAIRFLPHVFPFRIFSPQQPPRCISFTIPLYGTKATSYELFFYTERRYLLSIWICTIHIVHYIKWYLVDFHISEQGVFGT